jgi:protein-tyrosine phosphatase
VRASTGTSPPTATSYWVTPTLLAGKYPGSLVAEEAKRQVRALIDAGVQTFIDLTEEDECLPYRQLLGPGTVHVRIPVVDVTCPSAEQVRAAIDAIGDGERRGIVYLHCRGGCGRTGVVLGCYLVTGGATPPEALDHVHRLTRALWNTPCPETRDQVEMVSRWRAS